MGPVEINGLPAHVLLVHAVVVLVPLAALALVLSVLWPAARRRLGVVTPLLALVALVLVPITTHAGEWLERRLGGGPLIERHAELGDRMLPWSVAVFVVAAAFWAWSRFVVPRRTAPPTGGGGVATRTRTTTSVRVVAVVFAVLGVAVAIGSVWTVVLIGDSGAQAVWDGSF